jgi:hypothetical protein
MRKDFSKTILGIFFGMLLFFLLTLASSLKADYYIPPETPLPDLVPSYLSIRVGRNCSCYICCHIDFWFSFKNQGLGGADATGFKLWIEKNGKKYEVCNGNVPSLAPGQSTTRYYCDLWGIGGSGFWNAYLQIDPENLIPETNEQNNILSRVFRIK